MPKSKNTHRAYIMLHDRHKMIASGTEEYCTEALAYKINKLGPGTEGGVIPYDFEGDPWQKEWHGWEPENPEPEPQPEPEPPKLRSVGTEVEDDGNCKGCEL